MTVRLARRGAGQPFDALRALGLVAILALLASISCVPILTSPRPSPSQPALGPLSPRVISGPSPIASCNGNGQLVGAPEEPSLAVNPRDPRHLVATWQQDRRTAGGAFGLAVALSRDAGATWRESMLPGLTQCAAGPYELASDNWASIGADGTAYVGALGLNPGGKRGSAILVSAARDGGTTWGAPVVVAAADPTSQMLDKPSILADPRRARRVYAAWAKFTNGARGNEAGFSRSDDGGATWSQPVTIYKSGAGSQNNLLLALADGRLVDVFVEGSGAKEGDMVRVAASRSTDGGATWSQPATVANFTFTITRDPERGAEIRSIGQDVSAAVSGRRLYVAWFENHRTGTSAIWVSSSADAGLTWSPPSVVVQEAAQAFLPSLAVTSDGRLGATWYDLRNAASGPGLGTEVWGAVSTDRGITWRSRKLDGPFDLRSAPTSTLGLFVGDYEGLVGLQSTFATAYVRTPAGGLQNRTEIAFARF
jgi:hypothetical protein